MLRKLALYGFLCYGMVTALAQDDDMEYINFPLNSSLIVDGFPDLALLAAVMVKHENLDLVVYGFTDSTGPVPYNKSLSAKRAQSVKAYLQGRGVPESSINAQGKGVSDAFNNNSVEGRFQNRNVTLVLFETSNGLRAKVSYPRLLELFFGGPGGVGMQALNELKKGSDSDNGEVLQRISDLKAQLNAMNDALQRRLANLERAHAQMPLENDELPSRAQFGFNLGKYSGVSISAGGDDDGFSGQVRGLYFKSISDHFAIQVQGDASYYDSREEGQADVAAVFQQGGFKLSAAGSYKWASLDGFDAIRAAQGAVMADWRFEGGKFGLFASFPIADGDVIGSYIDSAYTWEYFVEVPTQLGLNFGVSMGDRLDFSGYASSLDTVASNADLAAGLSLQMLLKDQLSWYLETLLNEGQLELVDDSVRYQLGLKLGSWNQARYNVSDQITPVDIPRVRYEILTRRIRTGNTAPIAVAGQSQTDVTAGTVFLDGSGSSDPDGDSLSFRWVQTGGTAVLLSDQNAISTSFMGVAGNTYTFQLSVRDSQGASASDSVTIGMESAPVPMPVVNLFTALPASIDLGQNASLSWLTEHGDEVSLSGVGPVPAAGQVLVSPETTTEYILTVSNVSGSVSASTTLTVVQPPPTPLPEISFFNASPNSIEAGAFVTLSWSTLYADSVSLSGLGQVNASGSLILSPSQSTDYTLSVSNSTGSTENTISVSVNPVPASNENPVADAGADFQINKSGVSVSLDGSQSYDPDGDPLSYEWTQVGGTAVTLNAANTAHPNFVSGLAGENYTFRLVVQDGRGGSASDQVTAFVLAFKR